MTEEGKQVLALAAVNLPGSSSIAVEIEESEDLGVWISKQREDGVHFFLVRWEYILGIDIEGSETRVVGLGREKG